MRSYHVKDNYIGSAVSKILQCKQIDKILVTLLQRGGVATSNESIKKAKQIKYSFCCRLASHWSGESQKPISYSSQAMSVLIPLFNVFCLKFKISDTAGLNSLFV